MPIKAADKSKGRTRWLVLGMVGAAVTMNVLAFAAAPAYRAFTKAVGFAGIPLVGTEVPEPSAVLEREITVRFNSDISAELNWHFKPMQRSMTFRVGETGQTSFEAVNRAGYALAGRAAFNVTPLKAAPYFVLTACFCFDQQVLAANEAAEMPVAFFVKPEIAGNPNLDELTTITLSYTFFPEEIAAIATETVTRLVTAGTPTASVN